MYGFLNLNKPLGLTSHDCVAQVRRLLRLKKVGHGGTLDPAATGVLPMAIGKATRLLQYLSHEKAYRAKIRFGITTTTDDLAGEPLTQVPAPALTLSQVQQVLPQFEGKLAQIPPSYSAIQVGGKRLYDLARAGQAVEAPLRSVEVHRIDVLDWQPGEFPELEVNIACGAGTYIRSIARDLGAALGVGGTLAALERTASSGFERSSSQTLEELAARIESHTFEPISLTAALQHLPVLTLTEAQSQRWLYGQRIRWNELAAVDQFPRFSGGPCRVQQDNQQFLGIGQGTTTETGRILLPKLVWT